MFSSIRSKILAITLSMLFTLIIVLMWFTFDFFEGTKSLLLKNYSHSIEVFAKDINENVIKIENNAKDLALIGNLFYRTDRDTELTNRALNRIFNNYKDSLGGGIWFEPYMIDKTKKRYCFYAYRNKQDKIIIDESFNSEEYDYLNQGWYKQIISSVSKDKEIVWSSPYYENQGSLTLMVTAGAGIYDDNGKLVGISTVDWELSSIYKAISNLKPTSNSFTLFADKANDYVLVSNDPYLDNANLIGKSLKNVPWYNDRLKVITYFKYNNKRYVPYVKTLVNNIILVFVVPKTELFFEVYVKVITLIIFLLITSLAISLMLYGALKKYILTPIDKLIEIADKISAGEDTEIKLEKPKEFAGLAQTFDRMTKDIKEITKEREHINSELAIAHSIQVSSLPNVFPPFPDCKEFDIYATMKPAKEVGGDFYDFYFIDNDNFMFLIADVSGKGVPAALFMMTVKTLVSNLSQIGYSPKELIEIINKKISESNTEGFFVTMFIGIVNIKTGNVVYINCGHNQPLIKSSNRKYRYMNTNPNIVLGAFADSKYEITETQLNNGDIIFTYTDGITEAINSKGEMLGESRLKEYLNNCESNDILKISENISKEVLKYTDNTPQNDDLTMLIFKFNGTNPELRREMTFNCPASLKNYKSFYTRLHKICEEFDINKNLTNKIDMCCEEIFANITFYAYPEKSGSINISINKINNRFEIQFEDEGIPYNPLERPDPDITLSPEQRPIGGLGIFMVKEMADDVRYKYADNKNILTLSFNLES